MKERKIIRIFLGFIIFICIVFVVLVGITLFKAKTISSTSKNTCVINNESKISVNLENKKITLSLTDKIKNHDRNTYKYIGVACFLLAFVILLFLFYDLLKESIKFSKIDLLSKNYVKTLEKINTQTQSNIYINIDKEAKISDNLNEIKTSNYKDCTDLYKYYANAITEV